MFKYLLSVIFILFVSVFTFYAIEQYAGKTYIYIFFTIVSTLLVYVGFRKNAIFFDTFIGIFLWLGFWLKATYAIVFLNSVFAEGLRAMIITGKVFDEALVVTTLAFTALIFASYIRERFFFTYFNQGSQENTTSSLFIFYTNHRKKILFAYIILFLFIGFTNFYFGIYQRGELAKTILPFGLNGVYKWLLLFGISSFSVLILKYEFDLKKKTVYLVPLLTLIEAFITNVSLLSRGMVLNTSAMGYGMLSHLKNRKIRINIKFLSILIISFIILFLLSVKVINNLRYNRQQNVNNSAVHQIISKDIITTPMSLIVKRWVGMEGMLAVSNNEVKGWSLFQRAMSEKAGEYTTSFYDENIISSPYKNSDMSNHHYMSLSGFIAFFYYSNSIIFLLLVTFTLSLFAASLEYMAYRMSGENLIFAALIAQVIAYRYTHFGYAPAQSYLLFGSIILNIFIIYGADKILFFWYKLKQNVKQ